MSQSCSGHVHWGGSSYLWAVMSNGDSEQVHGHTHSCHHADQDEMARVAVHFRALLHKRSKNVWSWFDVWNVIEINSEVGLIIFSHWTDWQLSCDSWQAAPLLTQCTWFIVWESYCSESRSPTEIRCRTKRQWSSCCNFKISKTQSPLKNRNAPILLIQHFIRYLNCYGSIFGLSWYQKPRYLYEDWKSQINTPLLTGWFNPTVLIISCSQSCSYISVCTPINLLKCTD